jgi:hypothetical protein
MVFAVLFGNWVGTGQFENIILIAVGVTGALIIVFVRDYWWAPILVITAMGIGTTALGFPIGGLEFGVIILGICLPVKMAMKTLSKAEPEMSPGLAYWALLGFFVADCVIIMFYNKIQGSDLKSIEKSYFQTLVPLIVYGLLVRYCHTRTVWPTVKALFFTNLVVLAISTVTLLKGIDFEPFTDLRINIAWLSSDSAMGILRSTGPTLFIGCLAFWPAIRSGMPRFLLVLGLIVSAFGSMASSGRLAVFLCLAAGVLFAIIRGKLWIALPFVLFAALVSAIITSEPELLFSLPTLIQRPLAPLNFSDQGAQMNDDLAASDNWHNDLRNKSLEYWLMDTNSFWLGHGFKSWDLTIPKDGPVEGVEYEHLLELAVEMGATENMFSSITNIFGMTGLLLYSWFLLYLAVTLFKGRKLSPHGSVARALCEFSLVNLIAALIMMPIAGYVPSLNLIYWQIGILAARPYLVKEKPAKASVVAAAAAPKERPAFARPAYATPQALASERRFRPGRA